LIYPSADIIEQRVGSRYSLVVLAAKRAKQIKEGAPVLIDTTSTNPLTIALEEIAAGKVTILDSSQMTAAPAEETQEEQAALGIPSDGAKALPLAKNAEENESENAEETNVNSTEGDSVA
jgi:DNA-directed RNA polymerase subunit omega